VYRIVSFGTRNAPQIEEGKSRMSTQPKIALVTGASRGLGRNTALHLAEKGVDLVITSLSNAAEADSVVTAAKESGASAVALQRGPAATTSSPCLMRSSAGRRGRLSSLATAWVHRSPNSWPPAVRTTPRGLSWSRPSHRKVFRYRPSNVARNRDPTVAAAGRKALMASPSPEAIGGLVAATPAETALEALRAWTAGHPLGTKPCTDTAPTLLITSDDTFASRELVRNEVASRFPHPETARVPGAGHWPHVEQPAAVARILTGFIADV
jgi:pimeloyl-ACP methyl ester carboxylesterase